MGISINLIIWIFLVGLMIGDCSLLIFEGDFSLASAVLVLATKIAMSSLQSEIRDLVLSSAPSKFKKQHSAIVNLPPLFKVNAYGEHGRVGLQLASRLLLNRCRQDVGDPGGPGDADGRG